jgi:hypothetical protein
MKGIALLAAALLIACTPPAVRGSTASPSGTPSAPQASAPQSPNCASLARPDARSYASMAYMPNIGKAVLFGGWSVSARAYLGDTWTWQSGCWAQLPGSTGPSPRETMALTYDPQRKVVVAFGGRTDPSRPIYSSETWLWDGESWSQTTNGPALAQALTAFDPTSLRVLLYGWASGGVAHTWRWDGAHWQQLDVPSPPARSGAGMAFDPSSNRVLLFGGLGLQPKALLNDSWAWNGSVWSSLAPEHSPSPRLSFSMVPFSRHHEVLLVGGVGQGVAMNDAWVWSGSDWSPSTGVDGRTYAAAADVGSAVFLFGGTNQNSQRNDGELWNGSSWVGS